MESGVALQEHDLDCPLCRALLLDPVTTSCGHNYCKQCIIRALDYSNKCPICRKVVYIGPTHPVNTLIRSVCMKCFPEEYRLRQSEKIQEDEEVYQNMPLFVLTVGLFPHMPLHLHVYEQRYILMIQQCLEGNRTFGVVSKGMEVGTLAVVENCYKFPDGRANVKVRGTKRFKILNKWTESEGYEAAKIDTFEDDEEEAALDVQLPEDVALDPANTEQDPEESTSTPMPEQTGKEDVNQDTKTINLMLWGQDQTIQTLCTEMRKMVISKLMGNDQQRLEMRLGVLPEDPELLSFWLASALPFSSAEKQKLLESRKIKERLLIELEHLANHKRLVINTKNRLYPWLVFLLLVIYFWMYLSSQVVF